MSIADQKAALAAAYSSGERPAFHSIAPGGLDEIWMLANIAMVVPVVPPDCPPDLEYALRLRRDAMTEGMCSNCNAVPELRSAGNSEVPVAAALFDHRRNCSGHDEQVKRLLAKHRSRLHKRPFEDHFAAASRAALGSVEHLYAEGEVLRSDESKTLAFGILGRLLDVDQDFRVCDHLREAPLQVWNILIGEGTWRCAQCWAYFEQRIRDGFRLPHMEDHTCDLCRRYAPTSLRPLVLRLHNFVLKGGACARCRSSHVGSSNDSPSTEQEATLR